MAVGPLKRSARPLNLVSLRARRASRFLVTLNRAPAARTFLRRSVASATVSPLDWVTTTRAALPKMSRSAATWFAFAARSTLTTPCTCPPPHFRALAGGSRHLGGLFSPPTRSPVPEVRGRVALANTATRHLCLLQAPWGLRSSGHAGLRKPAVSDRAGADRAEALAA